MVARVLITAEAAAMVAKLRGIHGPLMFHQSGGCCDGSAPMCYPAGEFRVGAQDVLMGEIAGAKFYIGANQFEYWATPSSSLTSCLVAARVSASKRPKAFASSPAVACSPTPRSRRSPKRANRRGAASEQRGAPKPAPLPRRSAPQAPTK